MDGTITIMAKVDGKWKPVSPKDCGDTVPDALAAMNGGEFIIKWEPEGADLWYFCGTEALAKAYKEKTRNVLTLMRLLEIYYRRV